MRLLLLLLALSARSLFAQGGVQYEIRFPNRVHHEAEITATFTEVPPGPLEVRMSRSSPGRYALHEFGKNVYGVRAEDGRGRALAIRRPDPYQWNVEGHDGTVRFSYTLFADRADGTYSAIDATHAHLNMPATFAWARGLQDRPITVRFHRSDPSWRIATQLAPTDDPERFTAPDLPYFLDSPTELSDFALREWPVESEGKRYTIRLAVHHDGSEEDVDRYLGMAKRIVAEEQAVFGELPDFDYGTYTFLADYLPHAAGDGMEHRNSTVISSTRPIRSAAVGLAGTLAHEFFHAWNVERIRPRSLEPFDFEEANMSGELWFAEGFTQYYTPLFLKRAGLTALDEYAASLSGTIEQVVNGPGRRFFSPVEMSMQAPFTDAAASIDPNNRGNTFISYYTYGAAVGLGLDLLLRTRFPGRSLDGYMRAVWETHGEPERPYSLEDLRAALARYSGDAAFAEEFFRRYVSGREVVDYEALLAPAGLLLRRARPGRPYLGPGVSFEDSVAVLSAYTRIGTPLYEAGLDRGDRLLSLDGRVLRSEEELDRLLDAHRPGDRLAVVFEQLGRRVEGTLVLREDPTFEVVPFEAAGRPVTDAVRAFRDAWLGGNAGE